jgi:hypothetical protein
MSKEFKVGDTVFSIMHGFGEVVEYRHNSKYPIILNFSISSNQSYTEQGFYQTWDKHPTLFHSPQEASEYFAKVERPKVKKKLGDRIGYISDCISDDIWEQIKDLEVEVSE